MEDVLSCQVCSCYYDLEIHRPKSLPCGHTFCQECLQHINLEQGRLECPIDKEMCYEAPEELADNQSLKGLILRMEVRCPRHLNVIVHQICLTHRLLICEQCLRPCNETCIFRSLLENKGEVLTSLCTYLDSLEGQTPLTLAQQQRLAGKYKLEILDLLQLIRELEAQMSRPPNPEQSHPLYCGACGAFATLLDLTSFEVCCYNCSQDRKSGELGQLPQLRIQVATALTQLFKRINFFDLSLELLEGLQNLYSTQCEGLQMLGKWVVALAQNEKEADFADLPLVFHCPGCFQKLSKESCYMRKLPCLSLHAICISCAERQAQSQQVTICPLDQMQYLICATTLPTLQSPPQAIAMLPKVLATSVQSIPLSLPQLSEGCFFIDRFLSVLPGEGIAPKPKGWGVNFLESQVEVLTLFTSNSVRLYGLGLANPVIADAYVKQLAFYEGTVAAGAAFYNHLRPVLLKSSQGVLTYVYLSQVVELRAGSKYTLKVQFVPAEEPCEKLMLFRGNPESRPEVWIGSDDTVWDFESATGVEPGELVSGRNDLSGPILRLLYLST